LRNIIGRPRIPNKSIKSKGRRTYAFRNPKSKRIKTIGKANKREKQN